MAAIGKIRQRSGLLIIIIGVALAAFVFSSLLKSLGKGKAKYDPTVVGYINEEKISTLDFRAQLSDAEDNYLRNQQQQNPGKTELTSEERYNVQLQVWEQVESQSILRQQCQLLGLAQDNGVDIKPNISMEEYADMLTGNHPHAYIVQNFKNKQGQFDPTMVTRFLSSVEAGKNSENPKDREQAFKSEKEWTMLEKYIKDDQLSNKYYNLITKAYFVPKTIAKLKYEEKNSAVNVRYIGVRYGAINDSLVTPTDADYQAYYDEHSSELKSKEETRKIDYVEWIVRPSAEDIQDIEKNVGEMLTELSDIPLNEVPGYVNRNSNSPYDSSWMAVGSLSPFIDSMAFASEPGTIFNPWKEKNEYHFGRLIDVQMRPDSMRASHILIAYAGAARANEKVTRTKIGATALADSIFEVVKSGKGNFEDLVEKFSDGPSKSKQGDLDWFKDGAMVPEFNQACLEGKVGDYKMVETVFGYHIIKITGKKADTKKVRIAIINVPIMYSQKTFELAFNEASQFVSRARDAEAFDSVSVNLGLNVMHSNDLNKMSNGITGIPESRKIVQWLFEEKTELGTVSDVFDFSDRVVVALYNKNTPKGIKPLDDNTKEFIKILVMRDMKAKRLMEDYSAVQDLNAVSQKSGNKVDTANFFTFSAYSLRGYGPEQNVEGKIFVAEVNKLYGPIKGDQGIFYFVVDEKTEAQEPKGGYGFIANQEVMNFQQQLRKDYNNSNAALKAVVDISEIKDFRQYYY